MQRAESPQLLSRLQCFAAQYRDMPSSAPPEEREETLVDIGGHAATSFEGHHGAREPLLTGYTMRAPLLDTQCSCEDLLENLVWVCSRSFWY